MCILDIVLNKKYRIIDFGQTKPSFVEELNQIGFIEGETISQIFDVKSSKKTLLFTINNSSFFVNAKFIKHVVVEEINE